MESNLADLREFRRRKKRKRRIRKFIIILIVLALATVLYFTRFKWINWFGNLVSTYKETVVNSGKLAEGNYPLKLGVSSDYHISSVDKKIVVMTDTHYYSYTSGGSVLFSDQHAFSNPIMKIASSRALVYDNGGFNYKVYSKDKIIYSKKLDNQILFAKISNNGYVAIVTKTDKYPTLLTIYNSLGDEIFYTSTSGKITSVSFTEGSKGCVVSSLVAEGGQIYTKLIEYTFDKEEYELASEENIETLTLDSYIYNSSTKIIGDSMFCDITSKKHIDFSYTYQDDLIDYSTNGKITALLFENTHLRNHYMIIIDDSNNIKQINVSDSLISVHVIGDIIFLMTSEELNGYSVEGKVISTAQLGIEYDDFEVSGDYAYLLGYSIIDRIDYLT